VYDCQDDAIYDCLASIDLEMECNGVKLTKMEKNYLTEEYGADFG
jgi:hypothetical protein